MKIKKNQSELYGVVNYVQVAGIDMTKDKSCSIKFHPEGVSFMKEIGEDSRLTKIKDLSKEDRKEFGYCYNSLYWFPLEEVNLDWHISNKEFKAEDEYLSKMKKEKTCPIGIDNVTFMQWFIKMYPYLNDEWKQNNSDYMATMDKKILVNNENLLEGFKNQDMKKIRTAVKLGADINFELTQTADNKNNKNNEIISSLSPIRYAVAYQNKDLMTYLINKKVKIPSDLVVEDTNLVSGLYEQYKKTVDKKSSPKMR